MGIIEQPDFFGLMAIFAIFTTMLVMPSVLAVSRYAGLMDVPDERKIHKVSVSRLGGVAMAVAFFAALLLFVDLDRSLLAFLLGGLIVTCTGLLDDIFQIRPWMKFVGETTAAVVFVGVSGFALHSFGDLLGTGPIMPGSLAMPLTVFCMVGVMNALNLSDGLDGLAGGIALVSSVFMGAIAFAHGQWLCLSILLALSSCLFAFLCFNSHPARVFMGDTGSLLLGYSLAAVSIMLVNAQYAAAAPVSMAIIMALPLLDTLIVMGRRLLNGESPFMPDKKHFHHRLLALGIPHAAAVSIVYLIVGSYGALALALESQVEWLGFSVALVFSAVVYGIVITAQHRVVHLERYFVWQNDVEAELAANMHSLIGKSIPLMTFLIPIALGFPVLLFCTDMHQGFFIMSLAVLAMFMFPWRATEDRMGIAHGIVYFLTVVLIWSYHFQADEALHSYLNWLTAAISVWVVINLFFRANRHAVLTSGFEMLVIMVCVFIPLLLTGITDFSTEHESELFTASFQAIPFLLSLKMIIRRQPRRNKLLVSSLAGLLMIVGGVGLLTS